MSPFDAQQVLHVNLSRGRSYHSYLPSILEERSLGSLRKNACLKYLSIKSGVAIALLV